MQRLLLIAVIFSVVLLLFLYMKVQTMDKTQSITLLQAQLQLQGKVQAAAGKIMAISKNDHIKGNLNGKITLVEYTDLECPSCQQFQPTIKQIMQTYGDKIRFVTRNYPLLQHANAEKEAEASECAASLGGNTTYWKYTDIIFRRSYSGGTGFALTKLTPLAAELGIYNTSFQKCLDSGKFVQAIQDQANDAQNAGASALPATFIIDSRGNTKLVSSDQPFDVYKTIIDLDLQTI